MELGRLFINEKYYPISDDLFWGLPSTIMFWRFNNCLCLCSCPLNPRPKPQIVRTLLIIFTFSSSIGSFFSALTLDPIETKNKREVFYVHKGKCISCHVNLSDMKAVGSQMTLISVIKFLMQELEKIILINIGTNVSKWFSFSSGIAENQCRVYSSF